MGRGNPNPKKKFTPRHPQPLSKDTVTVRLTVDLDLFVRSLPNRTEWLRAAIAEKYERELQDDYK